MKVILQKDVPKLGKRYDIKEVKDGFALNSLIPKGLALVATKETVAKMEQQKAAHMAEQKVQAELLLGNLEKIKGTVVTISGKANDKGHLFAGIDADTVARELSSVAHVSVTGEHILLDKPIKEVGEHTVSVEILGKKTSFTLAVKAL